MSDSLKQQPKQEMEVVITSLATFKNKALEKDFRDFIWKDVYKRYRLLFIIFSFMLGMMTVQQSITSTSPFRVFLEIGIWFVVMFGLYFFNTLLIFFHTWSKIIRIIHQ